MKYVLFFALMTHYVITPVAIEFSTPQACEMAREQIAKKYKDRLMTEPSCLAQMVKD